MKIYRKYFLLALCISCLAFSGCSRKKNDDVQSDDKGRNFVYQLIKYKKTGQCSLKNPEKYFLTPSLYRLLNSKVLTKNGERFLYEVYYPEITAEIEGSMFYNGACDNGDWVSIAVDPEEMKRLEELQSQMIKDSDNLFNLLSEKERELMANEAVEKRLLDAENYLKALEYGSEIFIPQNSNGKLIFINSDKAKVYRSVYDESFRLIKKEVWNIQNADKANRISLEEYEYRPESSLPSTKTITTATQIEKIFYNEESLVTRQETYLFSRQRKYLSSVNVWTYDSEKRITLESQTEYKSGEASSKESRYKYKTDDLPPDYEYYENGTLKIKTVYSSKSDYINIIYFDDELSVHTYYEKNKKVKDVYYAGDLLLRETLYE